MTNKPVFFDATGRRAFGASIVGWTAAVVSLVLGAAFVGSLLTVPTAAPLRLPGRLVAVNVPELEDRPEMPPMVAPAPPSSRVPALVVMLVP